MIWRNSPTLSAGRAFGSSSEYVTCSEVSKFSMPSIARCARSNSRWAAFMMTRMIESHPLAVVGEKSPAAMSSPMPLFHASTCVMWSLSTKISPNPVTCLPAFSPVVPLMRCSSVDLQRVRPALLLDLPARRRLGLEDRDRVIGEVHARSLNPREPGSHPGSFVLQPLERRHFVGVGQDSLDLLELPGRWVFDSGAHEMSSAPSSAKRSEAGSA